MSTAGKSVNSRRYPERPIAGVGAVVFKGGRLLLVKRGKEPDKGKWSVPGGVIELGETVEEAVRREVWEECGIKIEAERVLDAADGIIRDEGGRIRYHFVIIDIAARYESGRASAGDDAAECGWFSPARAAALELTAGVRSLLERHGIILRLRPEDYPGA